jgi:Transposase IS116/IS110/IS902 family
VHSELGKVELTAALPERGEWQQRIQSVLYHHGFPHQADLMTATDRDWLAALPLPATARDQITVAVAIINALDVQIAPINKELRAYAQRQAGCRALMAHNGIGPWTAVTILAELGDARRFSSSRDAVRRAGLDITVKQSDQRRAPGHLSRQGPRSLRWALFEAVQTARRAGSPDHDYEAINDDDHRGRDGPSLLRLGPPPAQIPAGAANALGSCLGFWRRSGRWARGAGCGHVVAIARQGGTSASRSVGCAGFGAAARSASGR